MAGTRETSIRSYNFFAEQTVVAGGFNTNLLEFIDVDEGHSFLSHTLIFANDGATDLAFRFTPDTGSGVAHGSVKAGETLQMDFQRKRRIYFNGAVGLAFRFWAW